MIDLELLVIPVLLTSVIIIVLLGLVIFLTVKLRRRHHPSRPLTPEAIEQVFARVGCSSSKICQLLLCLELAKEPEVALEIIESLIREFSPRRQAPSAALEWTQRVLIEVCARDWPKRTPEQRDVAVLLEKRFLDCYAIIAPWLTEHLLARAIENCRAWMTRTGESLEKQSVETLLPRLLYENPDNDALCELYNNALKWDFSVKGELVVTCAINGLHQLCGQLRSRRLASLLQTAFETAKLRWKSFGSFWAAAMHLAAQQGLAEDEKHALAIQIAPYIRAQKMQILEDRNREQEYRDLYQVLAHLHGRVARPRNRHIVGDDGSQIWVSLRYLEEADLIVSAVLLNFSESRPGAWLTGRDGAPNWSGDEARKWRAAEFRIVTHSGRELIFPSAKAQGPFPQDEHESKYHHNFGVRVMLGNLDELDASVVADLRALAREHPITQ